MASTIETTPIHDFMHTDFASVRRSAFERGRLTERKLVLAELEKVAYKSAILKQVMDRINAGLLTDPPPATKPRKTK